MAAIAATLLTIFGAIFAGGIRLGHIDGKLDQHSADIDRIGTTVDQGTKSISDKLDKVSSEVDYIGGAVWDQKHPTQSSATQPRNPMASASTTQSGIASWDLADKP